eukprot:g43009.t1
MWKTVNLKMENSSGLGRTDLPVFSEGLKLILDTKALMTVRLLPDKWGYLLTKCGGLWQLNRSRSASDTEENAHAVLQETNSTQVEPSPS